MENLDRLPVGLIDVLANNLIFRHTAPYISASGLLATAASCKTLWHIIHGGSDAWRHLSLVDVKSAVMDASSLHDGAVSWHAQRKDEWLTEDEFYASPLRSIFNSLHHKNLLMHVQTLVLDGLSVPTDLVREILTENRYSVKILSIREVKHLNQSTLQQLLRYVVRPTRPAGTPKVKAIYFFGPKDEPRSSISSRQSKLVTHDGGVMASEGAQIGAAWNHRSSAALSSQLSDDENKWYYSTGRALRRPQSDWPITLSICGDHILFDAVLCRGPRHDIAKVASKDFLQPTIATIALGSSGCDTCHSCPEGPASFNSTPANTLPLLGPAPLHASTVRAAQRPDGGIGHTYPQLILRCEDCLRGRWCERCNRWWCEDCYVEPVSRLHLRTDPQQVESLDEFGQTGLEIPGAAEHRPSKGASVKALGVHRDCFGCGRTCEDCKTATIKTCKHCHSEYCFEHDTGCSSKECAWCAHSGRRTRELF